MNVRAWVGMRTTPPEAEVLKQDERGRLLMPAARREALLDEFERSGASGAKFARMAGIKYATFAGWLSRRRKERRLTPAVTPGTTEAPRATPVQLLEAVMAREVPREERGRSSAGLLIELPGGSRLRVAYPVQMQMAAELVALLAQRTGGRC